MISRNRFFIGLFSLAVTAAVMLTSRPAWAGAADHFDYPELNIAPRSSDRLESESQVEGKRRTLTFLPIQISGLVTLAAGFTMYDNPTAPGPGLTGMGVGAAWLLTGTALSFIYSPYQGVTKEVSAMPKGSVREQLVRERRAEEELKSAAFAMARVRWLSVATNLGAGIYMFAQRGYNGSTYNNTTLTLATTATAMAASLVPIFFKTYWETVWDQQSDYRKRIFAPVASATLLTEPGTRAAVPGLMVSLSF